MNLMNSLNISKPFVKLTKEAGIASLTLLLLTSSGLAQGDAPPAFPVTLGAESHLALALNKAMPYKMSTDTDPSDFSIKQGFILSGIGSEGFLVSCTTLTVFVPGERAPSKEFLGCNVEKIASAPADVSVVALEKIILKSK